MDNVDTLDRFIALDVETANPNYASICQIGAVKFEYGKIVGVFDCMVDPCTTFSGIHTDIHGIDESRVEGQPTFPEVLPRLERFIDRQVVVHHGFFDRSSLHQATELVGQPLAVAGWADTVDMARRAWPELPNHRLPTVSQHIGHPLPNHHHALADANAAGHVYIAAMYGPSYQPQWPLLSQLSLWDIPPVLKSTSTSPRARKRSPQRTSLFREYQRRFWQADRPRLAGEEVVIANNAKWELGCPELQSQIERHGGKLASRLSDQTTTLVVPDQELAGAKQSHQHKRARGWMRDGQALRVVSISEFKRLAELGD